MRCSKSRRRLAQPRDLPWWQDAGQPQDVLQILKNHGVNMLRLRPSSAPPYANVSQAQCSGNACYGETDAQDLDLAKRAKNLGMSLELTLLFDGGSSSSVPPAWAGDTELTQLQADLYTYVKAEILDYRQAGTMPDLVSIGNEVDTGFLGVARKPHGRRTLPVLPRCRSAGHAGGQGRGGGYLGRSRDSAPADLYSHHSGLGSDPVLHARESIQYSL